MRAPVWVGRAIARLFAGIGPIYLDLMLSLTTSPR